MIVKLCTGRPQSHTPQGAVKPARRVPKSPKIGSRFSFIHRHSRAFLLVRAMLLVRLQTYPQVHPQTVHNSARGSHRLSTCPVDNLVSVGPSEGVRCRGPVRRTGPPGAPDDTRGSVRERVSVVPVSVENMHQICPWEVV